MDVGDPRRIEHRARPHPLLAVVVVGGALAVAVLLVRAAGRGGVSAVLVLPLAVLAVLALFRLTLRRVVVADDRGVDLPVRGRRVGWGEVSHVEKPGPVDDVVVLRLLTGQRCRTNLPAGLAPGLADLGRVPLRD